MTDAESKRPDGYDALPKRFKDYVRKIEDDYRSLREKQPVADGTRTRVALKPYGRSDDVFLPSDSRVVFFLADGNEIEIKTSEYNDYEQLEVKANSALIVIPEVSNTLRLASYRYDPATGRRAKK